MLVPASQSRTNETNNILAYILGLVATFISLFLMNSAQPALLYLVPFTLIPTILVAAIRGDLDTMWLGDSKVMSITSNY